MKQFIRVRNEYFATKTQRNIDVDQRLKVLTEEIDDSRFAADMAEIQSDMERTEMERRIMWWKECMKLSFSDTKFKKTYELSVERISKYLKITDISVLTLIHTKLILLLQINL